MQVHVPGERAILEILMERTIPGDGARVRAEKLEIVGYESDGLPGKIGAGTESPDIAPQSKGKFVRQVDICSRANDGIEPIPPALDDTCSGQTERRGGNFEVDLGI